MSFHTNQTTNIKIPTPIEQTSTLRAAIPRTKRRIGLVVTGSVALGLIVSLIMALLVFVGAREPVILGTFLASYALGWAVLAWASIRYTDQPQRWALLPAALMGTVGLGCALGRPSSTLLGALGWVWPFALLALVVWMVRQSRRSLHSWSRRAALYPVFAVLVVSAVGGAYETVRESQDHDLAMPGQLVDVGDHKLHINCTGSGSPTVVLEAGLGEPSTMMAGWIAPAVAGSTTVCVYDRAGYGWSEPAPSTQDGLAVAADLHALLEGAHAHGPYVVVGHSTGGVYARIFAAEYPDDVAGMVLLDSQPSSAMEDLPNYSTFYSVFRRAEALAPSLGRLGILRLVESRSAAGLPEPARSAERAFLSTPDHFRTVRDEFAELPDSLVESQALTSLGKLPLIVVTAGQDAQAGWLPLQDEMATLSSNSIHRVIDDATHSSLTEDEADSANASDAIIDVVAAVRSGEPLARGETRETQPSRS